MQAYWLELETEWLRSEPSIAGVLAFCFLANNYGYTGDWFQGNIRDLQPTPTLDWFRHAFAPAATYVNLTDERYTKYIDPHKPGSHLLFTLAGINNLSTTISGKVTIRLYDASGKSSPQDSFPVKLASFQRTDIPAGITLPAEAGGYLLVAEFTPENGTSVLSRRFLKVGEAADYLFYKMETP